MELIGSEFMLLLLLLCAWRAAMMRPDQYAVAQQAATHFYEKCLILEGSPRACALDLSSGPGRSVLILSSMVPQFQISQEGKG